MFKNVLYILLILTISIFPQIKLATLSSGEIIDYSETFFSFTSSGNNIFYVTKKAKADRMGHQTYINLNSQKFGPYEKIYNIKYYPETNRFSASLIEGTKFYVLIDGKKFLTEDPTIVSDKSGKFLTYIRAGNQSGYIDIDGKTFGPFNFFAGAHFSEDGSSYSFRYAKNNKYFLIINGREFGPYDGVSLPEFAQNNRDYIFLFTAGSNSFLTNGNTTYGPYYAVSSFTISANGDSVLSEVSYSQGSFFTEINGVQIKESESAFSGGAKMNQQGEHLIIAKPAGKDHKLLINGNIVESGRYLEAVFSENLKHYIYSMLDSNIRYIVSTPDSLYEGMGEVHKLQISNNGEYAFAYQKYGNNYFNISGREIGPITAECALKKSGYVNFAITKQGLEYRLRLHNFDSHPMSYIYENSVNIDDSGNFIFSAEQNGELFAFYNLERIGPYQSFLGSYSSGGYLILQMLKKDGSPVLLVNGKEAAKNSFAPQLSENRGEKLKYLSFEGNTIYLNEFTQ